MKILDKYIFTTFLKTFGSIFSILLLIFILQSVWLLISDLAGKDLNLAIISKFLFYLTPTLVPMVLPLTILLTSIMIFGNFAENYEFAAMKSSGISLQRAMKSLSIFIIILSFIAFLFANYAIPWSEFKFRNLRKNIAQVNPALAISEGQFNQILDNINIKVDKKYGEEERMLDNVTLHKLHKKTQNTTVIKAKKGELASSEGSNILQLILYDGNYYEDFINKDIRSKDKMLHAKSHFERYTMNIDLSSLGDVDMGDETVTNNYLMLNASQLVEAIDSLSNDFNNSRQSIRDRVYNRLDLKNTPDTKPNKNKSSKEVITKKQMDTVPPYKGDILELFPNNRKDDVLRLAVSSASSTIGILEAQKTTFAIKTKIINKHELSFHDKFVLALACIVLFFIGAPLGAIIRKGGFGLPIVFAITIFLAYHFIGIFAKNSTEDDTIPPFLASYLSTFILLPFGILLTRNATRDRGVFNADIFKDFFLGIGKLFTKKKKTEIIERTIEVPIPEEKTEEKVINTISHNLDIGQDNFFVIKNIESYLLESQIFELQTQLDKAKNDMVLSIYKIKELPSTYIIYCPTDNLNTFVKAFSELTTQNSEITGYWHNSNPAIKGDVLLFSKEITSLMAISNKEQAYKIDDNLNLMQSENREKITYSYVFNEEMNFLHFMDILPSKKNISIQYEEQDTLLTSSIGTYIFALLILINATSIFTGENVVIIKYLAVISNTIGGLYFMYSAFKKNAVVKE